MKPKLKLLTILLAVTTYLILLFLVIKANRNSCCCSSDVASITASESYYSEDVESQTLSERYENDEAESQQNLANNSTSTTISEIKKNLDDSYYEEQALADFAIDRYINNEWDGYSTVMEDHTISISGEGCLLIDGFLTSPSKIHSQHCLDLPTDINRRDYMFIFGDGSYLIENNRIVKYLRGKEILLSGGTLNWNGMALENYRPYDTYFYYDEPHDTLFLVASSVPYDLSNEELKYNVGIYLYIVPDRTKSEIEFVSEITNLGIDEYGLFYADTAKDVYRYTDKYGKLQFVIDSLSTYRFSKLGVAYGEIEFDWLCTFADGYIGKRSAFPEGTFNHPVVTTPSVSLTDYNLDWKYKNIYSY